MKSDGYRFTCRALLAFKSVGVSSDAPTFCFPKVVRRKGNIMNTLNEKNYLVIGGERVEVSIEVKKAYQNMQDNMRIKQRRHGECCCPRSKWYACTTDCLTCPFRINTNVSLDSKGSDEDESYGEEFLYQQTKQRYRAFDEDFAEREEDKAIFKRACELMPENVKVGEYILAGYTHAQIAEMLGMKRSTLESRIAKVKIIIEKEFNVKFKRKKNKKVSAKR